MFTLSKAVTIALSSLAIATVNANPMERSPKEPNAEVHTYAGNTCGGAPKNTFTLEGSGSSECYPVTDVRAIQVSGGGCTVSTWSGSNCRGSHYTVPDNECHSVLYASVMISC